MRAALAAVPVLVLAAALTTGCGSSTGGTGSVADTASTPVSSAAPARTTPKPSPTARDLSKLNPCTVLTKAEADSLAGLTLQPAVRAQELCTYPTPTSGAVAQVEVYVGDGAKKYYDIDHTTLGHEFTNPAGVGDEAHLEVGAIFFRVGTTWFAIRLTRLDDVDTRPALTKLAGQVAGRLA